MAVKLAFQMIVFDSDYVLEPCIEALLPHGPLFVTEGPVRFWKEQGFATSSDRTNEILHSMLPNENIVHGQWVEKDEMQNAVTRLIPEDTTHVWLVDSDEVWDTESILKVSEWLEAGVDSVAFSCRTFYGGFERCLTGFEENFEVVRIQRWYPGATWKTHRPPTILDPSGVPWCKRKHIDHAESAKRGVRMEHYSYVFPSQMAMKDAYYANRGSSGRIADYMKRVYIPWVFGDAAEKARIENEFDGVHDWLPARRGPCRTIPFAGNHPESIAKRMPELEARFSRELTALKDLSKVSL